jgi:DNA-binding MarR family transcriptional regulator
VAEAPKGPLASPGFHLWNASLKWTQEVARALSPLELTHTQFFLLGAVSWLTKTQGAPPNQRAVADFAKLDKVMTSQVTRTLEGAGLIKRENDPADSRAWLLLVTAKGQKVFAEAVVRVRDVDQHFFGAKAAQLRDELARLHGGP